MKLNTQFQTPPENLGQGVTYSYLTAWPWVFRRQEDCAARTTEYARTKADPESEGDFANGEPAYLRSAEWEPVDLADVMDAWERATGLELEADNA